MMSSAQFLGNQNKRSVRAETRCCYRESDDGRVFLSVDISHFIDLGLVVTHEVL